MEVSPTLRIPVSEQSQIGEARRQVTRLAERLRFGEVGTARAALVTTELAGNLVKHTPGGGELLVRPLEPGEGPGLEVTAIDRGPGIANLGEALRDGYSTAGSPGTGLGAVGRQSDVFQVYSLPGAGTVVLARLGAPPLPPAARRGLLVGAVCVAKTGEPVSGDAWSADWHDDALTLVVADGLGHGAGAQTASVAAVRAFGAGARLPLDRILDSAHDALRPTRGAAVSLARVEPGTGALHYAGVGNVAATVISPGATRSLVSHNGIVGHEMRRVQEFTLPWAADALLVLHSDGLMSRWSLDRYPGLLLRHPSVVAAVLYRDFCRGTDDVTVVAVREVA